MKRILGSAVVVVLALFLIMAPVQTAKAAEAGPFYVGVFGAYVMPQDLEIESAEIGVDEAFMAGLKFGYIFPQAKWFAMELEYNHIFASELDKNDIEKETGFANVKSEASLNNLFLNFIFRYPVDKWVPYIGAGIGWSWLELSDDIDQSGDDWAWQALIGVDYQFAPNWSAGIGARYFSTNPDIEDADVEYTAWMVTLGVNYHF